MPPRKNTRDKRPFNDNLTGYFAVSGVFSNIFAFISFIINTAKNNTDT